MKKKVFLFAVLLMVFSCERQTDETPQTSKFSDEHFVSIKQIKEIVGSHKFYDLMKQVSPTVYLTGKGKLNISISEIKDYKDKNGMTAFYLTKLSSGNIVVFASDDRIHAVMGITDSNDANLSIHNVPSEFSYWIEEEIKALEYIRENNLPQAREIGEEWRTLRMPLPDPSICYREYYEKKDPLLDTEWGQGYGYNSYTPDLGCSNYINGRTPTGCVATATAQIMNFHQYPSNYNWNAMDGTDARSRLMADIGREVGMKYDCSGSGAKTSNVPSTLIRRFGYSRAKYADYNPDIVTKEIKENFPVILAGGEKKYWLGIVPYYADGHAWVADGFIRGFSCSYDNNGHVNGGNGYLLFHMNWGWEGRFNGYFGVSNFSVNGNSYNYKTKMVYEIRK